MAATINPSTGRHYTAATDADGQRAREALHHARVAVLSGEPLPAELLAQMRSNIAVDVAEAERLKREKYASDLAEFRERRE